MRKTNNSINDFKRRKKRLSTSCSKKNSGLLHGITSKHKGDFYCLNCLYSFRTENKLKSHETVCKNKDFYRIIMSSEKDNILWFNQHMNSDKMPHIIYADIESLIKKIDGCPNNPENFSTIKIGEHFPFRYSMATIWTFNNIENKYTLYRGEDCIKEFCESLREPAKNINDSEKKRNIYQKKN